MDVKELEKVSDFTLGEENTTYVKYFTGKSYLSVLNTKEVVICNVTFEPVKSYTGDYNSVVEQGKRKVDRGFKPEIKPLLVNLEDYDTIIIGTLVWWYTYASAVATFLSEYDLSGKTIIPFVTNGGWIGHTLKDIKKVCKNAAVTNVIDIGFNTDKMVMSESNLEKWIASL
ncbi:MULTISPECIES: flavodoxin [Clostridium]|uniref:Flavodoxin n=3 Tax=Clostridium TaxID=1485 RepID=D8GSS0_CLOLD|nr:MULTISPECIES: flavodoxin [Clostridium]ADK14490.1 conserved hypothetical protein [Clostridium ljungdahlii DSM 13528]AGY77707.1 hypothetical protein CAETHG_3504 [Clostridium autoethanogenum DSM 10061]ALU37845.1 putative flavodoxin [Clostridium autoethanogenum DSM 10061]OAA88091.1 flavodoxin [Clostridium ljungdahlii DSM 13528]OVY49804.1 flavodoxin [Clostridium autoethanogenum]